MGHAMGRLEQLSGKVTHSFTFDWIQDAAAKHRASMALILQIMNIT